MNAEPESNTLLRGRWLAWSMWILTACLALLSVLFVFLNHFASFPDPFCCSGFPSILTQIMALACATVGLLIVSHKPGNSIGWILILSGFGMSLNFFALNYAVYTGVTQPGSLPFGSVMSWLASWIWVPSWWLIMTFLLLLFPDGKLPSRRWRLVAYFVVIMLAANLVVRMFTPGPLTWGMPTFDNPFGIGGAFGDAVRWADGKVFQLLITGVLASAGSLILRFISSTGIERQQIKWLAYAGGMTGLALVIASGFLYGSEIVWNPWVETALFLPFLGIPVAVGIAILKHRLFDIDLIINRTLVYSALTASVVGLYVLIVGGSGVLFQMQNNLPGIIIAISLIAYLIQPLRRRLQGVADRFVPMLQSTLPSEQPKGKITFLEGEGALLRRNRAALVILSIASLLMTLGATFVVMRLITPYDDARLQPGIKNIWHSNGIVISPLDQQTNGLQKGDLVVAVNGRSLESFAESLFDLSTSRPNWSSGQTLIYTVVRDGRTLDVAVIPTSYPSSAIFAEEWGAIVFAISILLIAGFVFFKRPDESAARVLFLGAAGMTSSIIWLFGLQISDIVGAVGWWLYITGTAVGYPLMFMTMLHLSLVFPQPHPIILRWRWLIPLIYFVPYTFLLATMIVKRATAVSALQWLATVGSAAGPIQLVCVTLAIIIHVRNYRSLHDPISRRQLRWVLFAVSFAGITGIVFGVIPELVMGRALLSWSVLALFGLLVPLALAFAILRYRLFDIDIIINRTLVYFSLIAIIAGFYVLVVGALSGLLQNQSDLAAPVVALLIVATLVQPLRRGLQNNVNRLLHFNPTRRNESQHALQKSAQQIVEVQRENVQVHVMNKPGSSPHTRLHGRWCLIARLAWAAGFTVLTAMYTFGFLSVRDTLSMFCQEEQCTLRQQIQHTDAGNKVLNWPGPPVGYADRLRPDQVEALERLGLTLDKYSWLAALQMGIPALVLLLIGAGLFLWKSDDWMVLFSSIMVATFPLHNTPLPFDLMVHQPAWEGVYYSAGVVAFSCLMIFPLIFPNGQFVPRWTRWMALYGIAGAFMGVFLGSTILEVLGDFAGRAFIGFGLLLPSFGTGVFAQLYRYFKVARPAERQQIKWVVVGVVGLVVIQFAVLIPLNALLTSPAMSTDPARALVLSAIPDTLWQVNLLLIPICITISILRYRLWDIDIIINRTLVYGALTGIIIIAFVVLVGLLATLFQSSGNSIIAIVATGLVALLFNPLRQRLQRGINRLMYGDRDEPYTALARLGRRLEASLAPEAVLPTVVTTVREVLRLPYVAIYLQQDSHGYKIVAESASPSLRMEGGRIRVPGMEREGRCIPLIHQGETLGYIVLGPRGSNEAFSSTDLHLLDDLAPQVGVAVHAVRLTADLQRSREQLVLAREEERRRLRRDLHDDLAPTLASLGLTASTVADLIPTNPETATALVKELQTEIRTTVGNIRRLVYDLRPPALDELGLLAAIRERASQYSNAPTGFHIIVDAPAELPALPAAVEVAAYRIVQEALENVSKHSQARRCTIRFANHNRLEIEITDDGIGLPPNITPGIGLRSMRERAEELGGSCVIERGKNGGTQVFACLPIGEYDGTFAHPDRG